MNYHRKEMTGENGVDSEPPNEKRRSPHEDFLNQFYLKLACQLLAGEITPEEFASQQTRTHLELEDRADHDGLLTQFLNNTSFFERGSEAIDLARRLGSPVTVLATDIDNLKLFNDTFGHPEGDRLIQTYGKVIIQKTRAHDLKARVGGDELCILLFGADTSQAEIIANRIRAEITEEVSKEFPNLPWRQTISIGIAPMTEEDNIQTLRTKADQALYLAKQTKDQTVVYEQPTSAHK